LLHWTPDANKAEGQAQFDYLSRLGDQLTELQQRLTLTDQGEIKAVGIVGSDVYDTLLILQALHPKLPDVVFFTTDLDARFLNPRERAWTRELLVASGYGLKLGSKLQGGIPAFRESEQTAQFAAALAALGNTNLTHLDWVRPRLYEIGNGVAVDWSKTNLLLGGTNESQVWLHPRTPSQFKGDPVAMRKLKAIIVAALIILLGLARFWLPLRRLSFGLSDYLNEPLNFSAEDFGDGSGFRSGIEISNLRSQRLIFFWILAIVTLFALNVLGYHIWRDTFWLPAGEPFSLTNGVSAWPGEIIRLLAASLAVCFSGELYFTMREVYFVLTRQFRLKIPDPKMADPKKKPLWFKLKRQGSFYFHSWKALAPGSQVDVSNLWENHYENGRFWCRMARIIGPFLVYVLSLFIIVHFLLGEDFFSSVRGNTCRWWDFGLTLAANCGFIVLALLTIDSAILTRHLIFSLGQQSVNYPETTRNHFRGEKPNINKNFLDDWIGLQLIVEITEHVGKLVYYPTGILLLLLFARNGWWDNWSFPPVHILIFIFNLLLSLASVFILQRTAKDLKTNVEMRLAAEVKRLRVETAGSEIKKQATADAQLLQEMQSLRRGAFVPFWENPILTALFASSGGITILQLLIWFFGRYRT
jgi:hypothetical protein